MDYTYVYKGMEILNMVLTCVFKIEEEAFDSMLQDGKFILEPFFSRYLATINVGAARGEIHARCEIQNSPLSKIISPTQLLSFFFTSLTVVTPNTPLKISAKHSFLDFISFSS
jgi:hypothetical protein